MAKNNWLAEAFREIAEEYETPGMKRLTVGFIGIDPAKKSTGGGGCGCAANHATDEEFD